MAMDSATTDCAAFDETVVFLSHFKDLQDPRQPGKVSYPLDEILLLCLLAVLAGAECFTEIALFGVKKLSFLRRFRPFKDGTPDHRHLGDILAVLDPEQFQRCFVAWMGAVSGVPGGVIAIDAKTVRRSAHTASGKAAIHMVSAFRRSAACARPGQSGGKVQRDHRDPQASGQACDRGSDRDHRCHGVPARYRAKDPRQEG